MRNSYLYIYIYFQLYYDFNLRRNIRYNSSIKANTANYWINVYLKICRISFSDVWGAVLQSWTKITGHLLIFPSSPPFPQNQCCYSWKISWMMRGETFPLKSFHRATLIGGGGGYLVSNRRDIILSTQVLQDRRDIILSTQRKAFTIRV